MEIQRDERRQRRIDAAEFRGDIVGIGGTERGQTQCAANDLDEWAVGRHVAEGATAALQGQNVACDAGYRQPLSELVEHPALADACFADDLDHAALAATGLLDIALETHEIRVAADVRRQPRACRRFQPGLEASRSNDTKGCDRLGVGFERDRGAFSRV